VSGIVSRLWVLPVEPTVKHLKAMFMGCPFDVDWDKLGVEIGNSLTPFAVKGPDTIYFMVPAGLDVWYDTPSGHAHLLMPLVPSKKTSRRHDEVGDVWHHAQFRPVMSLGIAPSLKRRHAKAFINSIATSLVDTSPVFGFAMETVQTDEAKYPLYGDFYRDYVGRGPISNQVMLEQDEGIE